MYKNRGLISDWDTLRLILLIERHGGVSGAARVLGVTHATVSRRLSRAEEDAGLAFFERLPAGLRLTAAGKSVLATANAIEPELNTLERNLVNQETGIKGPMRITIPPLMMTEEVSSDFATFATSNPEIELEFVGDNNLLNLHQREADIAIRVTNKPPETLWGRKLVQQSAGYYAQTEWLEKRRSEGSILQQQLPLLSFNVWKKPVPAILNEFFQTVKIVGRCDDMIIAMQMVRAGHGVTRMPRILGEAMAGVSRISELPWQEYSPIWVLTHPELRRVPKVQALMHHLAEGFSKRKHQYVKGD